MLGNLFRVVLYQPIFNVFVGLYNLVPGHDLGIVILLTTIIVRIIIFPLTYKYIEAQRSMMALNPKLEAIKKQHANDKQKVAQATMELYKEHKVNPLTSCLPLLLQLPIIIALYRVLSAGIISTNLETILYSFVHNPGMIDPATFGGLNLAKPQIILAVLAGIAQFFQARFMLTPPPPAAAGTGGKDEQMAATMNKQMMYIMPVMTILIGARLPAGLALYWLLSTLLMMLERYAITFFSKKKKINPVVVMEGVTSQTKVIEGTVVAELPPEESKK